MGLFDMVGKVAGAPARLAEDLCDAIGLPEPVGDIASGFVNYTTGNYLGLVEDGVDLLFEDPAASGASGPGAQDIEPDPPSAGGLQDGGSLGPSDGGASTGGANGHSFFAQSDTDFMNAIRQGGLPREITDDPAAMLALQARMHHITEMNQLMTQMMQAMHQMNMAVIQNVRV